MDKPNQQNSMKKKARITSRDIARIAGVSQATVSLVLNGKYNRMSSEVRERVLEAVKHTNYVPNTFAKGLKEQRSSIIAAIVENIDGPYYAGMVAGAELEAEQRGYQILIAKSQQSQEKEQLQLNRLSSGHVDGLIIMTASWLRKRVNLKPLQDCGLPYVFINAYFSEPKIVNDVHGDNFGGVYQATQHLIHTHKHERIAYLGGYTGDTNWHFHCEQSFLGYKKALLDAGIKPDEGLIYTDNNAISFKAAFNLTNKLLNSGIKFTALVAINDIMAAGAMKILTKAGLRIPEDVAVVGGTNNPYINYITEPPLTTVDHHLEDIGRNAANILIENIATRSTQTVQRIVNESLIIRQSCGCNSTK